MSDKLPQVGLKGRVQRDRAAFPLNPNPTVWGAAEMEGCSHSGCQEWRGGGLQGHPGSAESWEPQRPNPDRKQSLAGTGPGFPFLSCGIRGTKWESLVHGMLTLLCPAGTERPAGALQPAGARVLRIGKGGRNIPGWKASPGTTKALSPGQAPGLDTISIHLAAGTHVRPGMTLRS